MYISGCILGISGHIRDISGTLQVYLRTYGYIGDFPGIPQEHTRYISGHIIGISGTYQAYLRDTPGISLSEHIDISGIFQAYLRDTPGISQGISYQAYLRTRISEGDPANMSKGHTRYISVHIIAISGTCQAYHRT